MNLHLPKGSGEPPPPLTRGEGALEYTAFSKLPPQLENSQADLRTKLINYLVLAIKHKYLLTVIGGVFLFGGVIVTLRTPKIYSASTTIRIERSVPRVIRDQNVQSDAQIGDDFPQFYDTQYELIRSRQLADRVATALNLAQSDFLGVAQPSLLRMLIGRPAPAATGLDANAVRARRQRAVSQIMSGLSVQPVGQSSIVRITYAGLSPEWAQRISIAVAEQFEKLTLDMRFSITTYARNFLEERLQELKLKLETSERQLIEYAQKEGIVDVDNKQPQVLNEIQTVENAYAAAIIARQALEETWRQAQADGLGALPQVMSDPIVQAARTKLAQLRAAYQDRLPAVQSAHPAMRGLQAQISATDDDIRNQTKLIKASINDQYEAAAANEKALRDRLRQLKAAALDLRGRSIDYTIFCAKSTRTGPSTTGCCSNFGNWASQATRRATMFRCWIQPAAWRAGFPLAGQQSPIGAGSRIGDWGGRDLADRSPRRHLQDPGRYGGTTWSACAWGHPAVSRPECAEIRIVGGDGGSDVAAGRGLSVAANSDSVFNVGRRAFHRS